MHPINPDDDIATRSESVREWAYNCNAPADRAWILHEWDVWTPNPRYDGPPVPHPEDGEPGPWYERGFTVAADVARRAAQASGQPRTVKPVPGYPAWYIILEV